MSPLMIPSLEPLFRRRRLCWIALQPPPRIVVVEPLGPEHPGKPLAHDVAAVDRHRLRNDVPVELIGIEDALAKYFVECAPKTVVSAVDLLGKDQLHDRA